jgi:hypothetical protein
MAPDEGILEWRRKRNGWAFIRPTTTARAQANRSTRAFCGLQKRSADSLPASRPSLRPPPMTTNRGNDSVVRNGFPNTGPGRSEAATFSSCMAQFHPRLHFTPATRPTIRAWCQSRTNSASAVSMRAGSGGKLSIPIMTAISGASVILRPRVQSLLHRSRTKACVWRIISAPRGRLRCSAIRRRGFRNSGVAPAAPEIRIGWRIRQARA